MCDYLCFIRKKQALINKFNKYVLPYIVQCIWCVCNSFSHPLRCRATTIYRRWLKSLIHFTWRNVENVHPSVRNMAGLLKTLFYNIFERKATSIVLSYVCYNLPLLRYTMQAFCYNLRATIVLCCVVLFV